MKKSVKNLGCLLVAVFCFFSCHEEWEFSQAPAPAGEGLQEVFIPLSLPFQVPQSPLRSMSPEAEKYISSIDVLSFKTENGKLYFDYHVPGTDINTNGFKVRLQIKPNQQLVIIANASNAVSNVLADTLSNPHPEKDSMLSKLTLTLPSDGKWNTGQQYAALPMWGETDANITIDINSSPVPTIMMLRMVAKIDVVLSDKAAAKFQLQHVYLYNYATKGRIVPATEAVKKIGKDSLFVTRPSVPLAGYAKSSGDAPVDYTDFSTPGEPGKAMRGAIYAFESEAPAFTNPLDATCLVVSGIFTDSDNSSYTSFYRIDFISNDSTYFLDILRNHQYTVTIQDVSGRGYDNKEEAFSHKSMNMPVEILDWNAIGISHMEHIVFSNYYFMAISRDSLALSRGAISEPRAHNTITVVTDFPEGWVVDSIIDEVTQTNATWIRLSSNKAPAKAINKNIAIYLDFYKPELSEDDIRNYRKATIYFRAGRLVYEVIVKQHQVTPPTITLYEYRSSGPHPVTSLTAYSNPEIHFPFSSHLNATQNFAFYAAWTPINAPLIINRSVVVDEENGILPYSAWQPTRGVVEASSCDTVYFGGYPTDRLLYTFNQLSPDVGVTEYASGSYLKAARITFHVDNGIETDEESMTLYHEYAPNIPEPYYK